MPLKVRGDYSFGATSSMLLGLSSRRCSRSWRRRKSSPSITLTGAGARGVPTILLQDTMSGGVISGPSNGTVQQSTIYEFMTGGGREAHHHHCHVGSHSRDLFVSSTFTFVPPSAPREEFQVLFAPSSMLDAFPWRKIIN